MLRARASAAVRTCRVGFEACPLTQVLCLSINFYVRLLVRVYTSPVAVRDAASKQMYVFQSQGCDSFFTQRVGRKARPPPCPSPSTVVGDSLSAVQHAVHCAAALHMRSMCAVRAVKGKGVAGVGWHAPAWAGITRAAGRAAVSLSAGHARGVVEEGQVFTWHSGAECDGAEGGAGWGAPCGRRVCTLRGAQAEQGAARGLLTPGRGGGAGAEAQQCEVCARAGAADAAAVRRDGRGLPHGRAAVGGAAA